MKEYISSSLGNETMPNFLNSKPKMQIINHSKKAGECSKDAFENAHWIIISNDIMPLTFPNELERSWYLLENDEDGIYINERENRGLFGRLTVVKANYVIQE